MKRYWITVTKEGDPVTIHKEYSEAKKERDAARPGALRIRRVVETSQDMAAYLGVALGYLTLFALVLAVWKGILFLLT